MSQTRGSDLAIARARGLVGIVALGLPLIADTSVSGLAAQTAKPSLPPPARMTLQIDSATNFRFDVRSFDLGVGQSMMPMTSAAEIQVLKSAGPSTADLLQLGTTGVRLAAATIDVLDSLGAAVVTIRLTDVTVTSDHLRLSGARAALEQERIAQEEALAQLTADYQEAQRQLATAEELGKSRVATRQDLARARERAAELQQRVDLGRQRQSLLSRQLDPQTTLEESLVLRFGHVEVETRPTGARVLRPDGPGVI